MSILIYLFLPKKTLHRACQTHVPQKSRWLERAMSFSSAAAALPCRHSAGKFSFQGASVMLAQSSTDPALKPKKKKSTLSIVWHKDGRRTPSVAFELLTSAQTSTPPQRLFLLISSEWPLLGQRRSLLIDVGRVPRPEVLRQIHCGLSTPALEFFVELRNSRCRTLVFAYLTKCCAKIIERFIRILFS